MKLYHHFLTFTRGKQIATCVCLIHLFGIFTLLGHHLITRSPKPPRAIIVRTLTAPLTISTPPTKSAPVSAPVKESKPPIAKQEEKAIIATPKPTLMKPKPTASLSQKATSPTVMKKEIAPAQETATAKVFSNKTPLYIPKMIQPKAQLITESQQDPDPTYSEILISFLQDALQLPEYGEVKAKIEIDRFGHLVSVEILDAKSTKNREFLKKELPDLLFPCLNDSTRTFTITFRNVEIH